MSFTQQFYKERDLPSPVRTMALGQVPLLELRHPLIQASIHIVIRVSLSQSLSMKIYRIILTGCFLLAVSACDRAKEKAPENALSKNEQARKEAADAAKKAMEASKDAVAAASEAAKKAGVVVKEEAAKAMDKTKEAAEKLAETAREDAAKAAEAGKNAIQEAAKAAEEAARKIQRGTSPEPPPNGTEPAKP